AAARHGRSPLSDAFAIAHSISEPEPDVLAPGAATRPAGDSISLDQVFGDEGPRSSAPAAEPPALAAPPAASPAPTAAQTGGFSFDQFFSPSEPAERTSTAPA